MRKQEKQTVTYLIRPELSKEGRIKKSENEAIMRRRRDEGINSILISEVSEWHKKEYADEIKEQQKTSQAGASWRRLVKDKYHPSLDEVIDAQNDWWKTDALVSVANKGIKAEERYRRKQKIKKFFYVISGRRFLDLRRVKKDEEKEDAEIVQEFLDKVALEAFRDNSDKSLSENLYIFIDFATQKSSWRGLSIPENIEKIISDFKESRRLKDSDKANKKILLDFGKYFHQNYR